MDSGVSGIARGLGEAAEQVENVSRNFFTEEGTFHNGDSPSCWALQPNLTLS